MPDFDYRQKAWSAALIVLFFVAWELFCLMIGYVRPGAAAPVAGVRHAV